MKFTLTLLTLTTLLCSLSAHSSLIYSQAKGTSNLRSSVGGNSNSRKLMSTIHHPVSNPISPQIPISFSSLSHLKFSSRLHLNFFLISNSHLVFISISSHLISNSHLKFSSQILIFHLISSHLNSTVCYASLRCGH